MLQATQTLEWLIQQLGHTTDMVNKPLKSNQKEATLVFIKTLVDSDKIQQMIIKPFFEIETRGNFIDYLHSLPDGQEITSQDQMLSELSKGSIVVSMNNYLFMFDIKKVHTNTVPITSLENTVLGPQSSMSEDIHTNINLIRNRYHQPTLTVEMLELGSKSIQSLAVIYDRELVDKTALEQIKYRLEQLNSKPLIQSTAELQRLINGRKVSLFPFFMITERADRIVYNLSVGKIVLSLDGDPSTIVAPAIFTDFMAAMDDKYHSKIYTKFVQILRYVGLFITLLLPGFYVAATSYNPEILHTELALSVAGSRVGVPYPSYVEVTFMLIIMELLIEASIRLPKTISAAATTVGGLILGTGITEAALASNIMIIVVSAVAISNFAIPIGELNSAIRVLKYVFILFATIAGLAGLTFGLLAIVMYLTNSESYGEPYLKINIDLKSKGEQQRADIFIIL